MAICPKQGEIIIPLFGYIFNCDLSEHIQRNIFVFDYDEEAQHFIKNHLKAGDIFLDIGANVGFYSLLASRIVGETGKVISIEPNPKTHSKLEKTIENNNIHNITLLNIGLGKEKGMLDLFFDSNSGNDSATMVAHDSQESVKVEVWPLDEVLSKHQIDRINYLKIDVDGFEPDVFAGATSLLKQGKVDALQSEFCEYWLQANGSSPQELHDLLTQSGLKDVGGDSKFETNCLEDRFFVRR